jgi:hypothetical protein
MVGLVPSKTPYWPNVKGAMVTKERLYLDFDIDQDDRNTTMGMQQWGQWGHNDERPQGHNNEGNITDMSPKDGDMMTHDNRDTDMMAGHRHKDMTTTMGCNDSMTMMGHEDDGDGQHIHDDGACKGNGRDGCPGHLPFFFFLCSWSPTPFSFFLTSPSPSTIFFFKCIS